MQQSVEMKRSVIAAVDDMFFAAKIRATSEHVGVKIRFARSVKAVREAALEEMPSVIVVDLHSKQFDPFELARELKADERLRALRLIGFFSHVQTALQREAVDAGYDSVLPRSVFTKNLARIIEGKD